MLNEKYYSQFPNSTTSNSCSASRHLADTLEDYKTKVINKTQVSLDVLNDMYPLEPDQRLPDLIYKYDATSNTYSVGLKSGNRWLKGIFKGKNFVKGLSKEQLKEFIKILIEETKNGSFDDAINEVRKANQYSRKQ